MNLQTITHQITLSDSHCTSISVLNAENVCPRWLSFNVNILLMCSIMNRSSTHLKQVVCTFYPSLVCYCGDVLHSLCSLPSRSWYLCRAESRTWNAGWKHSNYLSGQSNALISNNMWAVISCFVIYRHRSEDILVVFSVYFQRKSTNPKRQTDLQSARSSLEQLC